MKTTSPKTAKETKRPIKVKALAPRKDPKGGRKGGGGCDDDFGCGGNYNEVVVTGGLS